MTDMSEETGARAAIRLTVTPKGLAPRWLVKALARRLRERGRDGAALVLPMTRAEIGSFLGLQLETVSRIFSRLHGEGILEVKRQVVTIRDGERLERLAARCEALL